MSFTEIKNAVRELSPKELAELVAFISKQDNVAWTQQIEDDAASGKLDFLFAEDERERAETSCVTGPSESISQSNPSRLPNLSPIFAISVLSSAPRRRTSLAMDTDCTC